MKTAKRKITFDRSKVRIAGLPIEPVRNLEDLLFRVHQHRQQNSRQAQIQRENDSLESHALAELNAAMGGYTKYAKKGKRTMAITLGNLAKYNQTVNKLCDILGRRNATGTAELLRELANSPEKCQEISSLIHDLGWRGHDIMNTVIVADAVPQDPQK